jgi:hypothetical protein
LDKPTDITRQKLAMESFVPPHHFTADAWQTLAQARHPKTRKPPSPSAWEWPIKKVRQSGLF